MTQPTLENKNLQRAQKVLFDTARFLDRNKIVYHLEGGTLLGLVRDKELLPWDHDIDISLLKIDADRLVKKRWHFLLMGYRVTTKKSKRDFGPIQKNAIKIIKIKRLLPSMIKWFVPAANKYFVVLDVFVKSSDDKFAYWEAKDKVMKVSKRYYESWESIEYLGHELKVPNHYKDYLTEKYGDWKTPIREWDCGKDEKTICS